MKALGRWLLTAVTGAALVTGLSVPSAAQTLYGAQAPPDSAYVRVFRAQDRPAAGALVLGSTRFDVHLRGLSDYRVVSPGIYQIVLGEGTSEIIARPGGYYTVAAMRDGVWVFEDPAHTDPARAQLVLYNLSNLEAVDLRTADAQTVVIPPLSPGAAGRITVNAVPVPLAVFSNGEFYYGLGDLGLERGSSYSVFVFDENRETRVFWAKAALTLD